MKILALAIISLLTATTQIVSAATLDVTITGVKKQTGNLLVAIYDSSDSFQKEAYKNLIVPADSDTVQFTIDNLAAGEFAIMLFHDIDSNRKLKTNLVGMPREPWGASLQGKAIFGPPKWSDVVFDIPDAGTELEIALH